MSTDIILWKGTDGNIIPVNKSEAMEIVPYAISLTPKQQSQIVNAFQLEAYDMAAEFAWKKAMTKLKETISTLGMKFIGELLNREDIDEYSTVDTALTDYSTINLAEQLGVIGRTGALKLRQANELIIHYFSSNTDEEFDKLSAMSIVKSSIEYVLSEDNISIALEFSNFRRRLLGETLTINDPQIEQLIDSPVFYLKTVLTILTSAIKSEQGAKSENSLANLNLILPSIWKKISENDKWNIGTTYRDVTASGNTIASSGVKNALLKVKGFDYVPENLRSVTFQKAAKAVIETHFAFNNFYNEPAVVRKLSNLGSTIPSPALLDCFQAYLTVFIGNRYGVSTIAANIADEKLSEISHDRWKYYFERGIQNDEVILNKLYNGIGLSRLRVLLERNELNDFIEMPKLNQDLYEAILKSNGHRVKGIAEKMIEKIKPTN
ncbi:hypothetical protein M3B46_06070 [Sphingobacterium daejeonense]|uniref:hypothetical protein n=1 Tax=Sphingobacterium daejeonense TaxID=371142 RepID=UPI0021A6C64C|nr:hypothetical protein [Sphingobacterium daejeonense]MCT1530554.1 hypothetical protein [Sphingobacterium daejeonense]